MRSKFLFLAFATGVAGSANAAEPFRSTVFSQAVIASCPSASGFGSCPNDGAPAFPYEPIGTQNYSENYSGLTFGTTSSSNAALAGSGSATASVTTNQEGLFPTLKTGAFIDASATGNTSSGFGTAATRYALTYNGSNAVPLSLVGSIDFDFLFPQNSIYRAGYGFVESFFVIAMPSVFGSGPVSPSALGCGQSGIIASATNKTEVLGSSVGGVTQNRIATLDISTGCDGQQVMLAPGDNVYVFAALSAYAQRGASTDATHTFEIDFAPDLPDDVVANLRQNLVLNTTVPEPANWLMLITGFGAIGATLRRRRLGLGQRSVAA